MNTGGASAGSRGPACEKSGRGNSGLRIVGDQHITIVKSGVNKNRFEPVLI